MEKGSSIQFQRILGEQSATSFFCELSTWLEHLKLKVEILYISKIYLLSYIHRK